MKAHQRARLSDAACRCSLVQVIWRSEILLNRPVKAFHDEEILEAAAPFEIVSFIQHGHQIFRPSPEVAMSPRCQSMSKRSQAEKCGGSSSADGSPERARHDGKQQILLASSAGFGRSSTVNGPFQVPEGVLETSGCEPYDDRHHSRF
eukprot:206036-Chlamydomonas_euryale.AAC.1